MKKFADHEKSYRLLEEILPNFDKTYASTAIMESNLMEKRRNDFLPFDEIKEYKIKGVGGNSYFKINFKEPVIQFVPHELQHFRQFFESRAFNEDQEQYVYSFIPSYIPNVNHLALHIPYGTTLAEETSVNKDYDSFNKFIWEQKYKAMSIDTLNRFLKEASQKHVGISNKNVRDKIRMCFEFCYWNLPDLISNGKIISFFPKKGFGFIDREEIGKENVYFSKSSTTDMLSKGDNVHYDLKRDSRGRSVAINVKKVEKNANRSVIHNFIYDRPKSIVDIITPKKTIAKIEEIEDKEKNIELVSETPPVKVRRANVTFLIDNGDEIKTNTQEMFITRNAAERLENGDLINCIIAKSISPKKSRTSFSRFVIVGKIGQKIGFDLKHFVALSAWKKLQKIDDNKSLCKMSTVSDFKKDVTEMIKKIDFDMLKFLDNEKTLNDSINVAIENLFPLFIIKDDRMYHNPPALISHIANFYPDALEDKELMGDISMLFDSFLNNQKDWGPSAQIKLRTNEHFEKIQLGQKSLIDLNHFIRCIPLIANRIVDSRLYSQHWKQWLLHN